MRILDAPARCAPLAGSLLFCLFVAACSSSNEGSGTSMGAGAGHTTSTASGTTSSGTTCPGDLAEAPNSAFCQGDPATIDCGTVAQGIRNQVCGVAVQAPTTALTRSSTVMEFAGSGPPQLDCFQPADYPKAGTPMTVTMSGVARIFSHGPESNSLNIEVHTVKRTGGADDGEVGPIVGKAVLTASDCSTDGVSVMGACGTVFECKYTYPGVPTETDLAILTNGQFWAPLYEYNDYIPNAQVKNGVWSHDVRALANDDYSAIPQAAIGSGIMTGLGAIAGEVHDCGNVRLSGATVGTNVANDGLTYFDNDEASPLPDATATSTSILGLYASFNLNPGPASVAALGLVGGKVTTVGYFPAFIYANSVTAVTFQGVWPFQIDAKP
jgi:hypothetical protein